MAQIIATESRFRNSELEVRSSKRRIDMLRSSTTEQVIKNVPTPEEIRQRAYEIHIERGGFYGCDMDDLLQAERELQEKYNKNSGAVTRKTKPEGGTNASTTKQ
jgi:hypothetical protein